MCKDQKTHIAVSLVALLGRFSPTKQRKFIFLIVIVRASMSHHEEKELWITVEPTGKILTWCSCMPGASRCCNLVIAALHKVDFANTQRYCSPACLLMSYRWNTSTKTVIRPKRIKDIVITKRLYLKMGETSDEGECREFTIPIEIHNFDPR